MKRTIPLFCILCALLASCLGGCAAPLPTFDDLSPGEASRIFAQRAIAFEGLRAECDVVMREESGRWVRLDGAMVVTPHAARISLWKFGRDALDLMLLPEGTWVLDSGRMAKELDSELGQQDWSALSGNIMTGAFLTAPDAVWTTEPDTFLWEGPAGALGQVHARIDRRTLALLQVTPLAGDQAAAINLSRHVALDGFLAPRRLEVDSPRGRITIRLRALESDQAIDPVLFQPGRGWHKLGSDQ